MEIKPIKNTEPVKMKAPENRYDNPVAKKSVPKDTVEISTFSKMNKIVEENIDRGDAARRQKIQDLRKEINQGRYEISEKVLDYVVASIMAQGII